MATNPISTYLVFADLQMAAEAFLNNTRRTYVERLTLGNNHASRFTQAQAEKFVAEWEVVDQKDNTSTGFSGTLFKCKVDDPARGLVSGQLVMSFRSTEFIDDAARDNQATNVLEVRETGWAFGQIADMMSWYDSLKASSKIPSGASSGQFSVTGYSLGANLATAFNQLLLDIGEAGRITSTYTFNGAGVGELRSGTLTQALNTFTQARDQGSEAVFTTTVARNLYLQWRPQLSAGATGDTMSQALAALIAAKSGPTVGAQTLTELSLLIDAVARSKQVRDEADRVEAGISSGDGGAAQPVATTAIAATALDYQLAVLRAAQTTRPYASSILDGLGAACAADRAPLSVPGLSPIYDLYGAPTPSAVANSQHHYGTPVPLYIEDQPLMRGSIVPSVAWNSGARLLFGEARLLVNNYSQNDFGDTHSLVLIVDSLSVQDVLARLDPNVSQQTLNQIMTAASYAQAQSSVGGQGKAEGDTLEQVLDAVRRMLLGSSVAKTPANLNGGTWANPNDRKVFHDNLKTLTTNEAFAALAGHVTVTASSGNRSLPAQAREDFGTLLSLATLSPFVLQARTSTDAPAVEAALGSAWGDTYAQWAQDKNLAPADRTNARLNFTDAYLNDRQAMLQWVSYQNLRNDGPGGVISGQPASSKAAFIDLGASRTLLVGVVDQMNQRAQVIFGSGVAETIEGFGRDDRLYGGAGNDTVNGIGGADTLEGNVGDDSLDGGTGNDVLRGGAGTDTYTFTTGSGFDQIIDSDGFGAITVTGIGDIDGSNAVKIGEGVWQTPDQRVNYTLVPGTSANDLYISFADRIDVIVVRNWSNDRRVGITLPATMTQPSVFMLDDGANTVTSSVPVAGQQLEPGVVSVPADAAVIDGGGGNDNLGLGTVYVGSTPLDRRFYGGEGNDLIFAGRGDDVVDGGSGNDMLAGNEGNDVVYGGEGNDLMVERVNRVGVGHSTGTPYLSQAQAWQDVGQYWQWRYYYPGLPAETSPIGKIDYWYSEGGPSVLDAKWTTVLPDVGYSLNYFPILSEEDGNDILFGGSGNDLMDAGTGNDVLSGDAGQDIMFGGRGDDVLSGGDDNDQVSGDSGNDELHGDAGDDRLYGGMGADTLFGGTGADSIDGDLPRVNGTAGVPVDTDFASMGADFISGGEGDDGLTGGGGGDTLLGGEGNDKLWGDHVGTPLAYQGNDLLDGGIGNDTLEGESGDDQLFGGAGIDWLDGGKGDDGLFGGADADLLVGGDGNDTLDGGAGTDQQYGGMGDDVLVSDGLDYLAGGAGNDTYRVTTRAYGSTPGMLDIPVIHDTEGRSTLIVDGVSVNQLHAVNMAGTVLITAGDGGALALSQATSIDSVDLTEDAFGDTPAQTITVRQLIERDNADGMLASVTLTAAGAMVSTAGLSTSQSLLGTSQKDLLQGGSAADDLDGGAGNDLLVGNGGRDMLRGGVGADTLQGGGGDDALFGGAVGQSDGATDTFVFNLGDGNDTVAFASGGLGVLRFGAGITRESLVITNLGGAGDGTRLFRIAYSAADSVVIEAGSDVLLDAVVFADGSRLTRTELWGSTPPYTAGNDIISGSQGADVLDGGAGNDTLSGLAGDDTLTGGDGNDLLQGGAGRNTYVFAAGSGTDEIVITADETATLRFGGAAAGTMRASLKGNDLWLVQAGGERVRVTGYASAPTAAAWSVVASDGRVQTLSALLATSATAEALAARRDNFLAEQRLTLGAKVLEQNLNPALPTATYRNFRTEGTVKVDVMQYDRVPQYEATQSTRLVVPMDLYNQWLTREPPTAGDSVALTQFNQLPQWFFQTSTSTRLVGWDYVKSVSTVTLNTSTSSQLIVTGTPGNDVITPDDSTAPQGHALFRGRIDTGAGNDRVDLNGQSSSWYVQHLPGPGAWIELGAGNDSVRGTDADDVIIGGPGSDTMQGDGGADAYLVGADATAIDHIHDDLDWLPVDWGAGVDSSGWSFRDMIEVEYAGGAGSDRVEFDATVQRALLSHRFKGTTLQLVYDGKLMLEIDYRTESLAAHLAGAATGAMPGVESFSFSDGMVMSLRELIVATPEAPAQPLYGSDGNDLLVGTQGNDTLIGGTGNDDLRAGAGSDVYVFAGAFGHDQIGDVAASASEINEIRFTDRLPSQVFATRDDSNVILIDKTTGDRVAVAGQWNLPTDTNAGQLTSDWRVSFADGTVWSAADVLAAMQPRRTSTGDDLWYGSAGDDVGDALQGDDQMQGNGGNDILRGGPGNDGLQDTQGNNLIDGGAGDDNLVANAGVSVLIGGAGADFIYASANEGSPSSPQLVLFNAGDGRDDVLLSSGPAAASVISIGGGLTEGQVQLRADGESVVLDFGGATQLTLLYADSQPPEGALVLEVIDSTSIRRHDLAAVLADFRMARTADPQLQVWSAAPSLQAHATGTSPDLALGGMLAYRYAMEGTLAAVPDATIQQHLSAPGFGASAQSIFGLGITGTAGDDNLTGTARNDLMRGLAGDDTLDGGAGADTMQGGIGDDRYVVDQAGDVVEEAANEGTDSVFSSVNFTLGTAVEQLTLTGSAVAGTGNAANNVLTGNSLNNTLSGLAGDDTLEGGAGSDTLTGGTGNDTYFVDVAADAITENVNEGTDTVQSAITWTLGSNLENLLLTGTAANSGTGNALNNVLTGNVANNTLTALAGDDWLDGGAGADMLVGGVGNDTYVVDAATDVITEKANEGTDTVRSAVSWTLASTLENLTLTGSAAINATGNAAANVLTGNVAGNALNGGAGADTMQGGAGDDIYTVDNVGDVVIELANEGTDRVNASVTFTLANHIEHLTLTGTVALDGSGNALNNALNGNSANNVLAGGAGDDTLNGGAGADTMNGGVGNDTYVVDAATDVIIENAAEGIDSVQSSVNFVLVANVENLTLTGSTATLGTGNALNNVITGNGIGNTLDAGAGDDSLNGGAGVDTMIGGIGNDLYIVNTASDVVAENANEGIDTVQSSVTLTLANNVENLTLTGTGNLNGTGNAGANQIVGNSGNNTLDGGTGADTLRGGAGNDTYVIDDAGDVVVEMTNEGVDLVRASVTLALSMNVENLTLSGTAAINGTGNELDNLLTGNSANNVLVGGAGNDTLNGGAGNDTMTGGLGNDTYVVNTAADVVTEAADEGIDTVQSSVALTLGSNVENLILTGAGNLNGTGNALDNGLIGNSGNNTLSGGAGNDVYDGGIGSDTLTDTSTTSNDTYRWGLGQGNDTISDGGGTDRIEIAAGVTASQISLVRSGNNLQVKIGGATDMLTVANWYLAPANRVETIALADGSVINAGTAAPLSLAAPGGTALRAQLQMRNVGEQAALTRGARLLTEAMAGMAAGSDVSSSGHWQRGRDPVHGVLATPL